MSEYEYKVGDKVEVAEKGLTHTGMTGVVIATSSEMVRWPIDVHINGSAPGPFHFAAEELRLLEPDVVKQLDDGEVRTVSSTGAEKGTKTERHDLIPAQALATVAKHYGRGASKYDDHNWRRGYEWSKSYAALQRHANAFWAGEDDDPESGSPHMAAVAFHALTLLTYMDEQPGFDDRWSRQVSV